jgi:hypothetical protein
MNIVGLSIPTCFGNTAAKDSLHKAGQLESFKGTLAKTAMAGHETNFFAQRELRKHARELIHRTRQIAATL